MTHFDFEGLFARPLTEGRPVLLGALFIRPVHSLDILSISLHILHRRDHATLCTYLLVIYRIHIYP